MRKKCICSHKKEASPWVGESQDTKKWYAGCYTCGAVWQTHHMRWVLATLAVLALAIIIL